jgi:hypothetical protein
MMNTQKRKNLIKLTICCSIGAMAIGGGILSLTSCGKTPAPAQVGYLSPDNPE